ncbi:hypothetical protein ASPWEDRAFT_168743 [Aspergillus wentii DTO 134E9]|uniref:Uncharacterized protein n=1 Tax=Aspergillus wentii DTO 134E9 TaxID=1073089 RepID=A0A1L9RVF8_ASPWE|nr:uncharacterized protein ASPWEDRAFT_168743 [Aspergillus wentii DTO 134E9]KAI9928769.1 hypothetical protein MW887_001987 [Aspergillus wentii]OJJ38864.1 hypothetical protein ASPWEDRAFT_168743 [Aspergillus wentii DTO 134E9]
MAPGIASPLASTAIPKPSTEKQISARPRLFHHSLVTKDFDALRFHAAASLQLQFGQKYTAAAAKSDDLLIASPYNEPGHLLDLKTLDTPEQLLSKALTILKPVREDYATAPYTEALNWQDVFDFLRELSQAEGYQWTRQRFYVVAFRSKLLPDIDSDRLYELDARSHQEATASGGLLRYWFGASDENRQNLATCLWRNRTDARLGGTGPWHQQARAAAREMYEKIEFTTLSLVIGEDGNWEFGEWTDEE